MALPQRFQWCKLVTVFFLAELLLVLQLARDSHVDILADTSDFSFVRSWAESFPPALELAVVDDKLFINQPLPYRLPFPKWYAQTSSFVSLWLQRRFLSSSSGDGVVSLLWDWQTKVDASTTTAAFVVPGLDTRGLVFSDPSAPSPEDVARARLNMAPQHQGQDCWAECGQVHGGDWHHPRLLA